MTRDEAEKLLENYLRVQAWAASKEEYAAAREACLEAMVRGEASLPRVFHVKTQAAYSILSDALIEKDRTPCVVYRSENDGMVWVRPAAEFYDGRFELLPEPPAQPVRPKTLLDFGYAPGDYMSVCFHCGNRMEDVDKRCITCKQCAEAKLQAESQPTKGDYGGRCNRSACNNSPATWANHGMPNRFYCEPCAKLINANNRDIDPPLCAPTESIKSIFDHCIFEDCDQQSAQGRLYCHRHLGEIDRQAWRVE